MEIELTSASDASQPVVETSPGGNREGTQRSLRVRIRQQEILAELGVAALQGAQFVELLNHTARLTAEGLESEFCKVLEYMPNENRLVVRAGVGWDLGVVGSSQRRCRSRLAGRLRAQDRQTGNFKPPRERRTVPHA